MKKSKSKPLLTRTNPRSAWKKPRLSDSGSSVTNELRVDKYKPLSLEEVSVHKKKVNCLLPQLSMWILGEGG
ncbi:hypothetical protein QYF36_026614 [Acer negundo]|nr:hypothetical protein QYF36_026614 [Acer negundo]